MSYDLRLGVKVQGNGENIYVIGSPEHDSPTYNLGKMFRACTGWDFVQGEWYPCNVVYPLIKKGIHELETNSGYYITFENPDGWGTVKDALIALHSLREKIEEVGEDLPLKCFYVRW